MASNPDFSYEPFRAIAQDDWVAVHGRYVGWAPQPAVAIDLFRMEGGKIVEHRDGLGIQSGPNPSGHSMLDGATDVDSHDLSAAANRELVLRFITTVLIRGEAAALPDFFDEGVYTQHNPRISDGIAGLQMYMAELVRANIGLRYTQIQNIMVEGNFVLAESIGEFDGRARTFFDLFRLESGFLAEHWDVSPAWDPTVD